jgi:hypothetical protein
MSHEIVNEMAQRRRDLRLSDHSRYQTLKVVVQRMGLTQAIVSLMYTNVGGHRLSDTRLGTAKISTLHPDGRALDPREIMEAAMKALWPEAS